MVKTWWSAIDESAIAKLALAQGDYLPRCFVPLFGPEYGSGDDAQDVAVREYDCIVVTQTCDLAGGKAPLVALCPIYPIPEYEKINEEFKKKGTWERVRKGRIEGLHLVASMRATGDPRDSLVADFRAIYSLPVTYLTQHASTLGERWRLQSPYVEHFSQAFARFFMRIGLPSDIPKFG